MIADDNLTTAEPVKFYKQNPNGNAEKLRNAVCKFVSEWGITDLDAAIEAPFFPTTLKKIFFVSE